MALTGGLKGADVLTITVPTGAGAASQPFDTEGAASVQVITPSDWVTSNIEIQVSADAITWVPLVDAAAGTAFVAGTSVDASQAVTLPTAVLAARYLKLVSTTSQTATKTLKVILKN